MGDAMWVQYSVPEWDMTKYAVVKEKDYGNRVWQQIEIPDAQVSEDYGAEPVVVDLVIPKNKKIRRPARLVVSLQILGGSDKVSWIIAHFFALMGYPALVVHRSKNLFNLDFEGKTIEDTLHQLDRNIQDVAIRHRQAIAFALDYLNTKFCVKNDIWELGNVSRDEVYAVGVSLGGITLSGLSVIEPLIKKAVIVMGGGDVAEILTTSKEPKVKRNVDALCASFKISREDLRAKIRKVLQSDNFKMIYKKAYLEGSTDSWKYRMVISLIDTQVPTRTQLRLQRLIGCDALYIPTGHYVAAVFLPMIMWYAYRFFRRG